MPDATPLDELLTAIPSLVETQCRRLNLSQRAAARTLGLSESTVTRIVQGKGMDVHAFIAIVKWLDLGTEWFVQPADAYNAYRRGWNDCASRVRGALDDEPGDGWST